VEYLVKGCKPQEQFRLGTELEKFVYHDANYRPAACNGTDPGIRALLAGMTPFRDGTVRDLCLWMLDLSREGLRRRDRRDAAGQDETMYLEPLQEAVDADETFAEELIRRFQYEWRQHIDVAVRTICEETMA